MELAAFLTHQEVTLDDIITEAKAYLHISPDDILFVCGSLVEGFGNEKSDVDLFLITSRQNISLTSHNAIMLIVGRCIVDISVVQRSEVENLIERFNEWSRQPRQPRLAKAFTDDDRKLLYRLRSGQVLYGADNFSRLQNQIGQIDLARHKLDWACYFGRAIQVDLAGLRIAGDQYSMLFASQELLGHTMDALLAGHNSLNPGSKWRVRQLANLSSEWELGLPGRQSGMSVIKLYLSLHCMPQSITPSAIFDHALRVVAFSRRVFPWAEYHLLHHSSPTCPLAQPVDIVNDRPLPHLDLDVTVRYQNGSFELLRLNGQGQIFTLSLREYSLLCLFDGVTPREYAIHHSERLWGNGSGRSLVEEMEALVRYGEFEARNLLDEQALSAILYRQALPGIC